MNRRLLRRQQTIDEALDAAVAIMEEVGVGGLSMSEIARRMGMRQPSLYKYFPSLHAVYDALFARGLAGSGAAIQAAVAAGPRGVVTIRAAGRALVRWAVENPALAQLLYWRPVPGFAPTSATFAPSVRLMDQLRAAFAAAVRAGELHPKAASAEAPRLFTIVLSGLISQQMANEPGAGFDTGMFTSLTDSALDMFFARYAVPGGPDAAPRTWPTDPGQNNTPRPKRRGDSGPPVAGKEGIDESSQPGTRKFPARPATSADRGHVRPRPRPPARGVRQATATVRHGPERVRAR